ncbi:MULTISPECIES: insulinase family protein [Psychrilyobacter]|uniref:Peptidase M16C associated domain-containing protein n=1 Tax=Psychrilyobacter piezotolerans TaxID=2293438 RepID=A0ABX9KEL6_9FUSO|nr:MULTISPECIES: insulinase family protein [Psychrilyobacter]MCS5422193.1 insulinase family protein [Psychrilyobacter sp. S5]NDI77697.1 hypothetical protein [Psychrilyobacter piezotolerans]RDE59084.1 hypothetical protein DV867_14000 [Psychrilyobacter sp. S5]REI39656.1 hypothetical protein DYH56_14000 [Psychrilyobacter piezotolerans]
MKLLIILMTLSFLISCGKKEEEKETFKLIETREVKNLGATSYIYEHIKTGARVIYLDDQSPEKVFGIAFKTPVIDDSGVNHVFEHAVLQGSKKYPDKNLFYELDTKNIPSFLNAMTGQDYTVYPFSAVEPKSFNNLLDIYLDAVFNPLVLEDENTLKREGWRYDRNPNNDELVINGIVYNEMKGAFSNPYRNLSFRMNRLMYPDPMANYRFSSGGLPSSIPNLDLDHLIKTHKKYYTPSNSIAVLAGKLDIEKKLAKLDEYYSQYDKTEVAAIETQNTQLKDEFHNESYPAPKGSPNIYIYGTLMKPKTPLPELMFITSLLADYEISPLKKLFVDKKISGSFGLYNDSTIQPRGYYLIQGAKKEEVAEFRKLMDAKMREVAREGIDPEIIDLALRDYKKQLAKSQYSKERASDLTTSIATSYFYYDKPYLFISGDKIKILEDLADNPEKIKQLIGEYFVNNTNKLEIFFTPDESLLAENETLEKEKLDKFEKNLNSEELTDLNSDIKKFNAWSKEPVDKKIIDSIPSIELKDLSNSEIPTVKRREENIDGVTFVDNDINTYDINLVSLKFDTSGFDQSEKLDSELFSYLMSASSTKDFSFEEVSNNLTKYFFKLGLNNRTVLLDNDSISRRFVINFEYLQDDSAEVYNTLENLFLEGNFDNKLEIKKRLEGLRDSILTSSSDANVINRMSVIKAMSMINPNYSYYLDEEVNFGGRGYYVYPPMLAKINNILDNYDDNFPQLQEDMKSIREKIFNKDNLLIFYANRDSYEKFKTDITPFLGKMKDTPAPKISYGKLENSKLAITVPAQNGSTSWGNNLTDMGYKYNGKYKIMSNMINEYLNKKIRVQNGAYGAWFYITLNRDIVASSYRDGEVDKTIDTYKEIPDYLQGELDIKQEKFDGFILKSMAKYYQAYTPDTLMNLSYTHYLYDISLEDMEQEKAEVLSASKKDISEFIEIMTKFSRQKYYSTVNNENIIKEKGSNSHFDEVIEFEEIK